MRISEYEIKRVAEGFQERFGMPPVCVAWAPGRVNIIGEHTDYTGGMALSLAPDLRMTAAFAPRRDRISRVFSENIGNEVCIEHPLSNRISSIGGWGRYVEGVISLHFEKKLMDCGFDAYIRSDIPEGAGLSSSAALELVLANGLRKIFDTGLDDTGIVLLCREVENRFLGIPSGLLDQLSSQLALDNCFTLLDFQNLSWNHIGADMKSYVFMVIDSGIHRELADSSYQERVKECRMGLEILGKEGVRHLRDLKPGDLDIYDRQETWVRRLKHIVNENERVLLMKEYLETGAVEDAGNLLSKSHISLKDLFNVSIPEMDFLTEAAAGWPGCLGARMIGGGFGGCCLAMLYPDSVSGFAEEISDIHYRSSGKRIRTWHVSPSFGAGAVIL